MSKEYHMGIEPIPTGWKPVILAVKLMIQRRLAAAIARFFSRYGKHCTNHSLVSKGALMNKMTYQDTNIFKIVKFGLFCTFSLMIAESVFFLLIDIL